MESNLDENHSAHQVSVPFPGKNRLSEDFQDQHLPFVGSKIRSSGLKWTDFDFKRRSAAIAVAFMPNYETKSPDILLILRSFTMGSHRGQIAFPGGMQEKTDLSPIDTAKRETSEEIGVPVSNLNFHGWWAPHLSRDGVPVIPVLLSLTHRIDLFEKSDEVEDVVVVPWQDLSNSNRKSFEYLAFGKWRRSEWYDLNCHSVWGLTARIVTSICLKRPEHVIEHLNIRTDKGIER